MIRRLAKLQTLNQRWLYLGTILLLSVPFVVTIPIPPGSAAGATRGLYETIEACPADGIVLIDSSWDMGSRAENEAQFACVVRHLCRRRIPFVVVSIVTPFGPDFAAKAIGPIAKEAGYVYGRDWVNAGYIQATGGMAVVIDGLCRDFQKIRPSDVHGTPAAELPLMRRVRSIRDIYMVFTVTYSPTPEWISFVKGQYGTPVAFGCMSIMGPNYYTYIDSKQLCGMLVGNQGAAGYEAMLGRKDLGTTLIGVASFGNAIIILAAVLGNVGMWAAARVRKGER